MSAKQLITRTVSATVSPFDTEDDAAKGIKDKGLANNTLGVILAAGTAVAADHGHSTGIEGHKGGTQQHLGQVGQADGRSGPCGGACVGDCMGWVS